jgi:predicted ATPase
MVLAVAAGSARSAAAREGRVVEIVGPPGAGKTTVLEALRRSRSDIHVPHRRRARYVAWFIATGLVSTPIPVARPAAARLGWRERMIMVHLGALHHLVQASTTRHSVTLFDQGPVFMLTRLHGCAIHELTSTRIQRWWAMHLGRWASTVDTVIRLDAPDTVLMERIRARAKWHVIKSQPEADAREFLRAFRRTSDVILSRLSGGGVRVATFDTSQLDVPALAQRLQEYV